MTKTKEIPFNSVQDVREYVSGLLQSARRNREEYWTLAQRRKGYIQAHGYVLALEHLLRVLSEGKGQIIE